jgi:CxxC motif-containing protein (DUF1111 family)
MLATLRRAALALSMLAAIQAGLALADPSPRATDPGPRSGVSAAGEALPGLTPSQLAVATAFGARNTVPFFLTEHGPVREARFQYKADGTRDGGVHALFVISRRSDGTGDARGCDIRQEDFASEARRGNLVFRVPTPVFGARLIEQIPDAAILANQAAGAMRKAALGIAGRPHRVRTDDGTTNLSGSDGTIARFGWKAQNKSLLLFSGEAYNVEMGISNELFPTERDETASCQFATTPNDVTDTDGATLEQTQSAIEKFALFMRFLAPPQASSDAPGGAASIASGRERFLGAGRAGCHTPMLTTGNVSVEALRSRPVPLYSELLLHRMGPGLADKIAQAAAGPDEFRTAPLWGLGQRLFFLHDGRTTDLAEAIEAHASAPDPRFRGSEANRVVENYRRLSEPQKQDVLNFLRSL